MWQVNDSTRKLAALATAVLLALAILSLVTDLASAQADTEAPAVPHLHIVAEGDNLTLIAEQYGVTVEDLMLVNRLRDTDVLRVGRELLIPGGEGDTVASVYRAQIGDTLASIARGYDTALEAVMASNRTINRDYVPVWGQPLAVMSQNGKAQPDLEHGRPYLIQPEETLVEIAARQGLPPAELARFNELPFPVRLYPGQRIYIPAAGAFQELPGDWREIRVRPQRIIQGETVAVYVAGAGDEAPTGMFAGQPLRFTPHETEYVALVGIDAFAEPGLYELELAGGSASPGATYWQRIPVESANFFQQSITITQELSDLLAPEIRRDEDIFLDSIYARFSETRKWDGLFQVPVTDTVVTAPYGGGRSYNQGPVTIYHTGTDFNGDIGTPILAAAAGTVVFQDELELRGQTVIIDHGLGVMTGYYHLSEAYVEVGTEVEAGQQIGAGGSTGLSTGPHLHWDLRIMGVPVDGMRWTTERFP